MNKNNGTKVDDERKFVKSQRLVFLLKKSYLCIKIRKYDIYLPKK